MIVGKSLIYKRVYVDRESKDKKIQTLKDKGYEVVELGGRPVALALKSAQGLCSGPSIYSARHCFGDPLSDVKGKEYELIGHEFRGRVTKDYSPPLFNVIKTILYFFGKGTGVYDAVRVSTPLYPADGQVGLISGGVLGQPVGLLTHVPGAEPEDLIDKDVIIQVDIPETDSIKAYITDYAVLWMRYDKISWPSEVLIAHTKKPLRPGNSGGPVYTA
ncbi:MAG: hypothetical protein QXM12_05820 [Nitrososphaerota archaeon]